MSTKKMRARDPFDTDVSNFSLPRSSRAEVACWGVKWVAASCCCCLQAFTRSWTVSWSGGSSSYPEYGVEPPRTRSDVRHVVGREALLWRASQNEAESRISVSKRLYLVMFGDFISLRSVMVWTIGSKRRWLWVENRYAITGVVWWCGCKHVFTSVDMNEAIDTWQLWWLVESMSIILKCPPLSRGLIGLGLVVCLMFNLRHICDITLLRNIYLKHNIW
jgi:hypothetical protein